MINKYNIDELNKIDEIIYKYIKKYPETDLLSYSDNIISKLSNIDKNFILERIKNIIKYRIQLEKLKKLPFIKQRTEKWYEMRKNILTASDLYDALSNANLRLAKKKAGVYIDNTNLTNCPPLKWGIMFEEMASRCYSQSKNNIGISEFSLVLDEKNEHFGASPDGINELGIMIEIKCPYSREIKENVIPDKYILQMQGQMAVCELDECDYIECNFKVISDIDEYKEKNQNKRMNHGIIAEFKTTTYEYFYIYSDPNLNPEEVLDNINKKIQNVNKNELNFIKLTPWVLNQLYIQKVYFDKNKWIEINNKILKFWEKVESLKNTEIEYKTNKTVKYSFIKDDEDDN